MYLVLWSSQKQRMHARLSFANLLSADRALVGLLNGSGAGFAQHVTTHCDDHQTFPALLQL